MLIGAGNPMSCPIHAVFRSLGWSTGPERSALASSSSLTACRCVDAWMRDVLLYFLACSCEWICAVAVGSGSPFADCSRKLRLFGLIPSL